jgi:WD40 repeat protein
VGACHKILFSYNGQYLIGLFYEVTSNVNPYAVKIWSTDDYSIRTHLHPIKCSIAVTSRHSAILYMAGKQKYGRGISLGLLDIDSCSLARELKSDPDTSIGDEIKRIILTKNEAYALVACTEYTSTFTCFVVFKLETTGIIINDDQPSLITGSMSNCTMILTRFNCDPNYTFSIVDSNNNGDQYMLTILRKNEMIIWQLNDGEILFNYDFNYLFNDTNQHQISDCQMNDNRLFIYLEQGFIYIWDITVPIGQFLLIGKLNIFISDEIILYII